MAWNDGNYYVEVEQIRQKGFSLTIQGIFWLIVITLIFLLG